jgi:putative tryptophan/tyrosine transport system substrate-binding protein
MTKLKNQIIIVALIAFSIVAFVSCNFNTKQSNKQRVSVIFPVTIDAFEDLKDGIQKTCGDSVTISFFSAEGDPSKFETAIQNGLLKNPDYLVTIGTQITNIAFAPKFQPQLKTVIAGAISSPELVDALVSIGLNPKRSKPVAIISDSPKQDIYELLSNTFISTFPNVKKVGIIYNPSEVNSKGTATKTIKSLFSKGINVVESIINTPEDIEKNIDKLIYSGVGAVIIPHDKNAVTKAAVIVKKCNEAKIPVLSLDDGTVKKGGVAIGISVNYGIVGNMIGESILEIKNNKIKAEDMPIKMINSAGIYLNSKALNTLGITIPKNIDKFSIKY